MPGFTCYSSYRYLKRSHYTARPGRPDCTCFPDTGLRRLCKQGKLLALGGEPEGAEGEGALPTPCRARQEVCGQGPGSSRPPVQVHWQVQSAVLPWQTLPRQLSGRRPGGLSSADASPGMEPAWLPLTACPNLSELLNRKVRPCQEDARLLSQTPQVGSYRNPATSLRGPGAPAPGSSPGLCWECRAASGVTEGSATSAWSRLRTEACPAGGRQGRWGRSRPAWSHSPEPTLPALL